MCYKCGVKVVTIYAFSIENFKRSKYEVDALMDMFKVKLSQITQHGDLLDRYGARVRILGQRELLKPDVLEAINKAVDMTRGNGESVSPPPPSISSNASTSHITDTHQRHPQRLLPLHLARRNHNRNPQHRLRILHPPRPHKTSLLRDTHSAEAAVAEPLYGRRGLVVAASGLSSPVLRRRLRLVVHDAASRFGLVR